MLPERDCAECTVNKKREWGCEGKAALPLTINGKLDYTCPRRPLLDDPIPYARLTRAYNHFKQGFLPNAGGIADQADKVMRLFDIISVVLSECSEETRREAENRNKRRSKAPAMRPGGNRGRRSHK